MISYEYSKNRSDDTSELASVAQKKKEMNAHSFPCTVQFMIV